MKKALFIAVCIVAVLSTAVSAVSLRKLRLAESHLENTIYTDIQTLHSYIADPAGMSEPALSSAMELCRSVESDCETADMISGKYGNVQRLVSACKTMLQAVYNGKDYSQSGFEQTYASLNEYLIILTAPGNDPKDCLSEFNKTVNGDENKFQSACAGANGLIRSNK